MRYAMDERIDEVLTLYWAKHRSFTQIAKATGLGFDEVRDAVMDSIVNHYGYLYRKDNGKEER